MNIDWFITRLCDQAKFCQFCNAPWTKFPKDVGKDQALRICDRLGQLRTDNVTICGGEPFFFPGLEDVVDRLAANGIRVILYTSATSDRADILRMLPNLHFLSLPVDAVSPEFVDAMRGQHQHKRVKALIELVCAHSPMPRLKIGTVVTRRNILDLERIFWFLADIKAHVVWRLYQFSPYGIGARNQTDFLIPDSMFIAKAERLRMLNVSLGNPLNIVERSRNDMFDYCIIMDSEGKFWRYQESYIPIGLTIFNNADEIEQNYNLEKHEKQKAWLI